MTKSMAEYLMEQGAARARLEERRWALLTLLQDRFGDLPKSVRDRIESSTDLERLRAAVRQAPYLEKLEDLKL
jgi:hypothetical protein